MRRRIVIVLGLMGLIIVALAISLPSHPVTNNIQSSQFSLCNKILYPKVQIINI